MPAGKTDAAVAALHRELTDVRAMAGCGTCECFLAVVARARADLKALGREAGPERGDDASAAAAEFDRWLAEARGLVRSCRNCEVCVPSGPYRRFRDALDADGAAGDGTPPAADERSDTAPNGDAPGRPRPSAEAHDTDSRRRR